MSLHVQKNENVDARSVESQYWQDCSRQNMVCVSVSLYYSITYDSTKVV
jgi:hypothetical protein